ASFRVLDLSGGNQQQPRLHRQNLCRKFTRSVEPDSVSEYRGCAGRGCAPPNMLVRCWLVTLTTQAYWNRRRRRSGTTMFATTATVHKVEIIFCWEIKTFVGHQRFKPRGCDCRKIIAGPLQMQKPLRVS